MGRIRQVEGTLKLSICKKGKTDGEERRNYQNRVIENKICLWVGSSGSGKTVANFYRTFMFHKMGYTCIRLTEKRMNPYESMAMMLPIKRKYHLDTVKLQGQEPLKKEELDGLVKIWHPLIIPNKNIKEGRDLISDIYKKKHFPINWFTFPVRMPEETIMSILMGNADLQAVRVCKTIIEKLKDSEDLWDMVDKVSTEIQSKEYSVVYDPKYMGIDIGMVGSKRTIESIANSFSSFFEHYCFQSENFELKYMENEELKTIKNLDIVSLANDNKHIHQLSTAYYKTKREKIVVIITFLIELLDVMRNGKISKKIYLSLDEIRNIMPKLSKEEKTSFQKEFSMLVGESLREIRNAGKGATVDMFTQELFRTDPEATASANTRHLLKISLDDKKIFIRDFDWTKSKIELLDGLQTGECFILEELEEHEGTKYLVSMPPFGIPEEDIDVVKEFEKEYPDRLVNYNDLYRKLLEHRNDVEKKVKQRLKDKAESRKKKEAKKKEDKEGKIQERVEKKFLEEKKKEEDLDSRDKRMEECYRLKRDNPKMSFADIATKVSVSNPTARKFCYSYAVDINDKEFLKKEGKEYLIK